MSSSAGRLGNQLILHAHLLAFATEHKVPAYFPRLHRYRDTFEGPRRSLVIGAPPGGWLLRRLPGSLGEWFFLRLGNLVAKRHVANRWVGSLTASFDVPPVDVPMEEAPFINTTARHRLLFLLGFRFRAYNYVVKHRDTVAGYFLPVKPLRDQAQAIERAAREHADVVVGVHVRQGDYAQFLGGRYFFSLEAYAAKMREIAQLFAPRRVAFLMVAESRPEGEAFSGLSLFHGPGTAVADMYSLSLCDYIFGVHSTFSQWGAFIGRVPHWAMDDVAEPVRLENFTIGSSPLGYPPKHLLEMHGAG